MRDVNKVILIGRLGADPIQRLTQSGMPVVSFSVATARSLGKGSKQLEFSVTDDSERDVEDQESSKSPVEVSEPKKETQWHRCVAWGKQGVTCAQYLKKGSRVYVEGSVRSRKFTTEQGDMRYVTEVHANEVSFLNSPRNRAVDG